MFGDSGGCGDKIIIYLVREAQKDKVVDRQIKRHTKWQREAKKDKERQRKTKIDKERQRKIKKDKQIQKKTKKDKERQRKTKKKKEGHRGAKRCKERQREVKSDWVLIFFQVWIVFLARNCLSVCQLKHLIEKTK